MTDSPDFVYELTFEVERQSSDELDTWLSGFIEDMLAHPGFTHARTWSPVDDGDRASRIVHFHVGDEAQVRLYLENSGPDAAPELKGLFGDLALAKGRLIKSGVSREAGPSDVKRCMNCDTILTGQYCGNCGQRAQSRLIRLHELVRDAFGDLFELDSRLWRTLVPLAIRPGLLTKDYLQGRRARYMPPFRMYLVLSLAFFLIAFFDPQEKLGILFEPEPSVPGEAAPGVNEAADDGRLADQQASSPPEEADADSPGIGILVGDGEDNFDCNIDYNEGDMPAWLSRRLTQERMVAACENIVTDGDQGFKSLLNRMTENIPAGLFILLPAMALVLMVLHPLANRYYVEHLLFVIHYHSFVFLILSADILFSRLVTVAALPNSLGDVATVATAVYIPVYLYRSMRRVYEGGRAVTFLRFSLLSITYFAGLGILVAVAALFAAFSV